MTGLYAKLGIIGRIIGEIKDLVERQDTLHERRCSIVLSPTVSMYQEGNEVVPPPLWFLEHLEILWIILLL
jgi:hypothetical protein